MLNIMDEFQTKLGFAVITSAVYGVYNIEA